MAFLALGVFFYSGATVPLTPVTNSDVGGGSPISTVLSAILLTGTLTFTAFHWRRCLPLVLKILPFLALLGLAAVSTLWSQALEATLRRSVTLLGVILYSVSVYVGVGPWRFMKMTLLALVGIAFAGVAIAVVKPAIGMDVGDYANAVRGLYGQKNGFGMALFNATLALCFLILRRQRLKSADLVVVAILIAILIVTRSTTSLLLAVGSFAATITLLWIRRGGAWRAVALWCVASGFASAFCLVAVLGMAGTFDLIGKDSTLTGRTEIWEAVWQSIGRRSLFGYGYSAFWLPESREVQFIWSEIEWKTPAAHSGYLEVRLQFGDLGVVLLGIMLFSSFVRIAKGLVGQNPELACWFLLFIVTQAIFDRTESGLLSPDLRLVFWIIATLALSERPPCLVVARSGRPSSLNGTFIAPLTRVRMNQRASAAQSSAVQPQNNFQTRRSP